MGPPHLLPVKGLGLGDGRLHLDWVLSVGSKLGVLPKILSLGHGWLHLDWVLSVGSKVGVLGSSPFMIEGALGGAPGPP